MTTDVRPDHPHGERVVYRWPRTRLVPLLGRLVIGLGVTWIVVTVLVAVLDVSGRTWYAAMAAVSLLMLGAGGVLFTRPPAVLELSSDGYRLHNLRGGGTTEAAWSDVTSVTTGQSVAGPVMVLEGRNRPPSVVPLALLGARSSDAQDRVRAFLQTAQRRG